MGGWNDSRAILDTGEQNNTMPVSGIGPHFVGFPACGLVIVPGMLASLLNEEKG